MYLQEASHSFPQNLTGTRDYKMLERILLFAQQGPLLAVPIGAGCRERSLNWLTCPQRGNLWDLLGNLGDRAGWRPVYS